MWQTKGMCVKQHSFYYRRDGEKEGVIKSVAACLYIRVGMCAGKMHSGAGLFLLELFFWTSKRKVEIVKLMFFFFYCHKKKKNQKEKSPLFENLLKSTGHLFHATTSRSLCSFYGSLT